MMGLGRTFSADAFTRTLVVWAERLKQERGRRQIWGNRSKQTNTIRLIWHQHAHLFQLDVPD